MRSRLILSVGLVCLHVGLQACRYNVRDLGFMEMPGEGYTLYVGYPKTTTSLAVAALTGQIEEALLESNITPVFFPSDQTEGVLPAPYAAFPGSYPLPAGLLVSPDGPGRVIPLATNVGADSPVGEGALDALTVSPLRQAILEGAGRAFGVIVLIEGTRSEANGVARNTVQDAIKRIAAEMSGLPKAVAEPPKLVVLAENDLDGERLFLWSLGLDSKAIGEPRAAVFYGRGKWIGPLMEGSEISVDNLRRLFWIVGADCECGMDLAWTRGTAIPFRWDTSLHGLSVGSLGFDPASPMFQMEAGRILSRFTYRSGAARLSEVPDGKAEITEDAVRTSVASGAVGETGIERLDPSLASARKDVHALNGVKESVEDPSRSPFTPVVASSDSPARRVNLVPTLVLITAVSLAASGLLLWRRRSSR